MLITINCFADIRDVVGKEQISVQLDPGSTLSDLFHHLSKTYGPPFDRQIKDQITQELVPFLILINGRAYRSITDMSTQLHDADVVTFLTPFDGG